MERTTWNRPIVGTAVLLATTLTVGTQRTASPAAAAIFAAMPEAASTQASIMTDEPFDVRFAQSQVDQTLVKRWAELVSYVIGEFRAADRDATAAVEGDYTTRRIRVKHSTDKERWVDRTLTEAELRSGDLRALAKRLYAESTRP